MIKRKGSLFGDFDFDYDGIYFINDVGSKPYYTWTSLNDSQLEDYTIWLARLKPGSTITYSSSSKKAEDEKIIEETGYVVPRFRFIEHLMDKDFIKIEDYQNVLSNFQLNNEERLQFKDIQQISAFRDSLLVQIIRQADFISEINQKILDVLKVYYYEIIMAMLSQEGTVKNEDNILDRTEKHLMILTEFILRGAKIDYIISQLAKWKKYPPAIYWDSTVNGLNKYCKSRNNALDTAASLVKHYLHYESLLEDVFLNNRIKTPEAFNLQQFANQVRKFQGDQYYYTVQQYYHKEESWSDAYDKVVEDMEELGLAIRNSDYLSLKAACGAFMNKQRR